MSDQRKNLWILIIIGVIFLFISSACSVHESALSATNGTYPVAGTFKDFYIKLGGEEVLGPAISNVFKREEVHYQYTANALMVYDPAASYSQRYQLAPIAQEWGIEEPPELQPDDLSIPYINGHQVWEEVQSYYMEFGAFLIGSPLTGVQYNNDKNRYEQYFTNLGFYRNVSDDPGDVHLMPYGYWFCGDKCSYNVQDEALSDSTHDPILGDIDGVFLESAKRLGNDFTGPAISATIKTSDGSYEKAYTNVVLYSLPENHNIVYLRPLPQLLGMLPDTPVPQSNIQGMYFYPVKDELGYNVPNFFLDYIALHGSMELSGPPIGELHPLSDGISRQCFTNYCLEYHADAPESMRVQPTALGSEYYEQAPASQPKVTEPVGAIGLQAWERYPLLPSGRVQEIGMAIDEDGVPLEGMEFTISVTLPDGTQRTYELPPTGLDGQATIKLDPIEAPNGSSIPYQACVVSLMDRPVCIQGMFLIWDNP